MITNSLEGVTPLGTALTAGVDGNTGGLSGDYFDVVTLGTGGTIVSAASPGRGAVAVTVTEGSAGSCFIGWSAALIPAPPGPQAWIRAYVNFPVLPSSRIRMIRAASGASLCGAICLAPGGQVVVIRADGSDLATGTVALTPGVWHRIEGFFRCDATAGEVDAYVFAGANVEGITPDEAVISGTTPTLGPLDRVTFGNPGSQASWGVTFDDLAASTTGPPGPIPATDNSSVPALVHPEPSGLVSVYNAKGQVIMVGATHWPGR